MQAILELQRQLKEVQSQKSKSLHKINERNAVDIIGKLLESKRLQLIYTQDGKEYLTHDQVRKEVVSLVADEGNGRMDLKDMPSHLGVGIEVVVGTVDQLVKEGVGVLINDSFITPKYISMMLDEIHDLVADKGIVELTDLTNKYWIPLTYLREVLGQNMQNLPKGTTLQVGAIVSHTFAERLLCKVRGIIRATTRPISLNVLASRYQIEEQKFKTLVEQLIREESVQGKISKGVIYTPTNFSNLQETTVVNMYRQNSYIELSLLSKLQISQPASEYLPKILPEIIILKTLGITEAMYQIIESQIIQTAKKASLINLTDIIPEWLKDVEDIQYMLQKMNQTVRLMPDGVHVCSTEYLNKCLGFFKKLSETEALKMIKQGHSSSVKQTPIDQEESKTSSKKQRSGKGKKEQKDSVEENSSSTKIICPITKSQIIDVLKQNKVPEGLVTSLGAFLLDSIKLQFKNIFEECQSQSTGKASANQAANIEHIAEQRYQQLKYVLKQLEKVQHEEITKVHEYLLESEAVYLLSEVIQLQALHNEVSLEPTRAAILKKFQKHIREIFMALEQKILSKDLNGFVGLLSEEIKNLGCRLGKTGPLDKKVERQIKGDLLARFKKATDDALDNQKSDEALSYASAYLGTLQGCYIGMSQSKEDWALKLQVGLLTDEVKSKMQELMASNDDMSQLSVDLKKLIE